MLRETEELMMQNYRIKYQTFELYKQAIKDVKGFWRLWWNKEYNQMKVLKAFQDERISDTHFTNSAGYGYDDIGRDSLDKVYARIFNTESAIKTSFC